MKTTPVFFLIVVLFVSCQEFLLGENEPNNPENNFEIFWNDLDKHYSLFYVKGTNWDSLYQVYRPQVTNTTDDYQLWNILSSLIEHLNDSHTVLYKKHDHGAYTSGFAHGQKAIEEEFSLNLIKQKYVTNYIKIEGEADLNYGKIKNKNIGYIFLSEEEGNDPAKAIERIVNELDDHKAIVFDIRTNEGGDKRYAKIIAGGFSDGEHLIATSQTRNGPHHDDFNGKVNEITQKTGAEQFLKPVILLTDRATMSGGEYLTLYMRSFNHVTQIGDTTAGDFSAVGIRRFLPNGMTYQYSIQMLLLPDGSSLDGIGIAPDIYIKNTKADISAQHDRVLEGAIQYLFNEYGIE